MANPAGLHLVAQRADDGLLTHHLCKAGGTVFAIERLVTHGRIPFRQGVASGIKDSPLMIL